MTQLIGALCEGGQKVVLVSDRLVGREGLVFERGSKGHKITGNAMVLTAGTPHEPEFIDEAKNALEGVTSPRVLKIAETLADKYREARDARIDVDILGRHCFASAEEFYRSSSSLHDHVVFEVMEQIEEYQLGVHALLGGVGRKAHLYLINDPGRYSSFDQVGFFCPGMGKEQAEATFVWYDFTPEFPLSDTLYVAFEAKRRAESAGSVGRTTDAWVIDDGGIHEIERECLEHLDQIYTSRHELQRVPPEASDIDLP